MRIAKGMIQFDGRTYRIERVMPHIYEAVRLLDNVVAGWFTSDLSVIAPHAIDLFTLRGVARLAVQQAKTSWVGRLQQASEPKPEPAELGRVCLAKAERAKVSGVRRAEDLFTQELDDESLQKPRTRAGS